MTRITVLVDDGYENSLERILKEIPFVKEVEIQNVNQLNEPETQYQRLKMILDKAKGKKLFNDINDPVEWQRNLRKEWDRDF